MNDNEKVFTTALTMIFAGAATGAACLGIALFLETGPSKSLGVFLVSAVIGSWIGMGVAIKTIEKMEKKGDKGK